MMRAWAECLRLDLAHGSIRTLANWKIQDPPIIIVFIGKFAWTVIKINNAEKSLINAHCRNCSCNTGPSVQNTEEILINAIAINFTIERVEASTMGAALRHGQPLIEGGASNWSHPDDFLSFWWICEVSVDWWRKQGECRQWRWDESWWFYAWKPDTDAESWFFFVHNKFQRLVENVTCMWSCTVNKLNS